MAEEIGKQAFEMYGCDMKFVSSAAGRLSQLLKEKGYDELFNEAGGFHDIMQNWAAN